MKFVGLFLMGLAETLYPFFLFYIGYRVLRHGSAVQPPFSFTEFMGCAAVSAGVYYSSKHKS